MQQYQGYQNYQISGIVDNQIGQLHNKLRNVITLKSGFELKPYDSIHQNVFTVENAIPLELSRRARDFLNNIPFDNTIKKLDDETNPPKDTIHKLFNDANKIRESYNNKKSNPLEWTWERYHDDFWRALPLSGEAFCGSPLIELIDVLEEKWYATKMPNFNINKYRKATWVIQRIEKGHGIGLHNDENQWRRLAFVYYLTSDYWDYQQDGGELCVCYNNDPENYVKINPAFNTMIAWDMVNQKSPLHFVEKVKAENNKARIALVGFFVDY